MRILITGGSGFIGTNMVEDCLKKGVSFINVDWNPPLNPNHRAYWEECDIMDKNSLQKIFSSYKPTVILHLAARTDTDIYDLNGDLSEYVQNTEGTKNVLDCINQTPSVRRSIIASTMFVCKAGHLPSHDQDFKPFTLYGVSKMISEQYTRQAKLKSTWTIIRPQTIWGPYCLRYRDVMFKVMQRGLYFHPAKKEVHRAYGYVKNVVWQIQEMLKAPEEAVHQKVFYVGDKPVNLLEWVNYVSKELTGKPARLLPTPIVRTLAITGDILKTFNLNFPITSTRFDSMTQDYLTPIELTYNTFGQPPYSIETGVKEIVNWYNNGSEEIKPITNKRLKVAWS